MTRARIGRFVMCAAIASSLTGLAGQAAKPLPDSLIDLLMARCNLSDTIQPSTGTQVRVRLLDAASGDLLSVDTSAVEDLLMTEHRLVRRMYGDAVKR